MTATRGEPASVLYSVEDAAERLAIGRTLMFALIRDHAIESVKVGRLRLIPAEALTTYINKLAAAQTRERPAR